MMLGGRVSSVVREEGGGRGKGGGEGSNGGRGSTVTVEDIEGVDDHCDREGWYVVV